jgi:threonyl-tRNA synthetase
MPAMTPDQLAAARHSLAHLLAMAVIEKFPGTKLTIGPAIEDGFYYDFAMPGGTFISADDLPDLENHMRKLAKQNLSFSVRDVSENDAKAAVAGNEFKEELVSDVLGRGESITFYDTKRGNGDVLFTDLCAGPHISNTSEIDPDSFKLTRIAGAYWRGDENKPMLTRIYGIAFATKADLVAHIAQQEEARKRDHKIIGPQLGLFTTSPLIGAGLPLIKPRGMIVRKALEEYLWEMHKDNGYERVWTPHIAKEALYETSGHAAKFGDELFRVSGKEEKFILKPMNCPHHMQIFADTPFSYRDMPVRYFEPATVYRDEKSGQLGGLTRVRSITQDDGHLFCRASQIQEEASFIVHVIKDFYKTMGMMDGYWVRLSLRGEDKSEYLGGDEVWEMAEAALRSVCETENLPFKPAPGEAAFYGPKLDFIFKDAIGREWQLATIQCDFNLPERFDLSFTNEQSEKERPVVIHRAISGSLERFMGVMIEHFAGAFPLWLSPEQAVVIPVSEKHAAYAQEVADAFKKKGLRTSVDDSNDTLGKKIRGAKMMKVPYMIVVGDAEVDGKTVTLESRDIGKIGVMPIEEAANRLAEEAHSRALSPQTI